MLARTDETLCCITILPRYEGPRRCDTAQGRYDRYRYK